MRILVMCHYYAPEVNAPASRTAEHARIWAAEGHEVTVITCAPNHPRGVLYPGYRNRLFQSERIDGVRVVRVWTWLAANEGFWPRVLNYLSYMVTALMALPRVARPDVILSSSPQFFCGLAGLPARWMRRVPWVLEVRDLWPESIVAVGAMRRGVVIRMLEWLERQAYRRADRVVAVSPGFVPHIARGRGTGEGIEVIENGVDLERYSGLGREADRVALPEKGAGGARRARSPSDLPAGPLGAGGAPEKTGSAPPDDWSGPALPDAPDGSVLPDAALGAGIKARFGLNGRFVAAYVGTLGLAHGLDTVLEAADLLRDDPRIGFLLVGDGAERARLLSRARAMGLGNLVIAGQLPKSDMPAIWQASDASLIVLRRSDTFKTVLPSKMFEAMAMRCPIVLGVEGDSAALLKAAGAGVAIPPQDAGALAAAVLGFVEDPVRAAHCGAQGRAHVAAHYDRRVLAGRYLALLSDLAR